MNLTPPYECPLEHCDDSYEEELDLHFHFAAHHELYEQRYAMMIFLDNGEYRKYEDDDIEIQSRDDISITFDFDNKKQKSAIRNHPAFTVEQYEAYFGSVEGANIEAKSDGYLDTDYKLPDEIRPKTPEEIRRERLLELNSTDHYQKYGRNYEEQRAKAIKRDDFGCAVCSETLQIHMHHIKPASHFHENSDGSPDYEKMNEISNLVTLCPECHGTFEGMWEDTTRDEFIAKASEKIKPK